MLAIYNIWMNIVESFYYKKQQHNNLKLEVTTIEG